MRLDTIFRWRPYFAAAMPETTLRLARCSPEVTHSRGASNKSWLAPKQVRSARDLTSRQKAHVKSLRGRSNCSTPTS